MKSKSWRGVLVYEKPTENCDHFWWSEKGIISTPDWADKRLFGKSNCCAAFLREVVSFFKKDYAGTGKKEAHYLFCQCCGKNICELPHAMSKESVGDFSLYFGKHRGKKLNECPVEYLKWCAENLTDQKIKKKINFYLDSIK